jgi:non-specific serine/threonine protein kinase
VRRSARAKPPWRGAAGPRLTLEQAIAAALVEPTPIRASERKRAKSQDPLTPREREVAVLVAQGFGNRQIATELMVSHWTAATHVRNILRKLGVAHRAQVAAWSVQREDGRDSPS